MFALAVLLLGGGSLAIAASIQLTWPGTILAAFILGMSEIVALIELLSVFHAIHQWTLLLGEILIAFSAFAWWLHRGRPHPDTKAISLRAALQRHRLLIVLAMVVAAALAAELVLALSATPNNWDSMTYHLSRAAAWYQGHAVAHVTAHTARENAFPPNAEILALYTMVFAGSDQFVALPQFFSELALLVAIFGIARRLSFTRAEAAFAALLFATLSEVVLQSTTTQNDLIVTACVVISVYFLVGAGVDRAGLLLAGLAFALATGTKPTAALSAPIIFLLAAFVLRRRALLKFSVIVTAAFAIVAAPVYVENVHDYGDLLGPPSTHAAYQAKLTLAAVAATFGKIAYRFIDFSGIQYLAQSSQASSPITRYVPLKFQTRAPPAEPESPFLLNGRANEDRSYFGPLGFLLIIPLVLGYLATWVRSRTYDLKSILALALPVYMAELAVSYAANPWIGRFMLLPVGLSAPLLARSYSMRWLRGSAAGVGVLFLCFALIHNELKPIGLGSQPIWTMERADAQALARPSMDPALRTVDELVPQHSTVGYVLGEDAWDYPLYGRSLERRLISLPPSNPLVSATRLGIHWVVVDNATAIGSRDWIGIRLGESGWSLLAPKDSYEATHIVRLVSGASLGQETRRSPT